MPPPPTPAANLTPSGSTIQRAERMSSLFPSCARGCTVWLTGLSGSGKSTVAAAAERALVERGIGASVLDGDSLRGGLCAGLGFSEEDRAENVRRAAAAAALLAQAGLVVLVALISPMAADRLAARAAHEAAGEAFVEVHVSTDLALCELRDPKGLYARARSGEIPQFTGVSAPYEAPLAPELALDTALLDTAESVRRVLACLASAGVLRPSSRDRLGKWRAGCAPGPRLVLHFDLNKTLLVSDPAKGFSTSMMVNSILSECCWGLIQRNGVIKTWVPIVKGGGPTTTAPIADAVTYGDYVERVQKLPRPERHAAKASFTEQGMPGERWAAEATAMLADLDMSAALRERPSPFAHYSGGKVYILPAFFELLIHLEQTRRDFAIVFRTFGLDLPDVVEEYNNFCEGRHPLYPDQRMDGTGAGPDRRLSHTGLGTFFRDDPQAEEEAPSEIYRDGCHLASGSDGLVVSNVHGFAAISALLQQKIEEGALALGLIDCYEWWAECDESEDSGKFIMVDTRDEALLAQHSIFFDDNVERDRAHIVDVRDEDCRPIMFSESESLFLVRAEPSMIIRNKRWFIEQLQQKEKVRGYFIGGDDDSPQRPAGAESDSEI